MATIRSAGQTDSEKHEKLEASWPASCMENKASQTYMDQTMTMQTKEVEARMVYIVLSIIAAQSVTGNGTICLFLFLLLHLWV